MRGEKIAFDIFAILCIGRYVKMKNGKAWLLIIILMGLIVGSCQPQTHEAIATATVIIKPSDTQAPTAANTPQPTETIYPSATLENIYEMVTTPTPETLVVRDVMSPNRRWQAIVMRTFVGGEERSIFKVQNDGSRVVWIVEDVAYEDVPVSGFPFPEPFYWSTNGQYLYFT